MASTYRLSGLTIFLILLAVLLIGYLLNHTWEYFSNRSEGFISNYANSKLTETVPGYSTNSKKVVQLDDSVYFDPVSKIFIEENNSGLVIRKRDGTTDSKIYGKSEVFQVGKYHEYKYNESDANDVCKELGAQVATDQQLIDAQQKGADWCSTGWIAGNTNKAKYPITTSIQGGCASKAGVAEWTPPSNKANVNCYGMKPKSKDDNSILKWNATDWSQHGNPVLPMINLLRYLLSTLWI
jgi:hypothetical protein